MLLNKEKKYIDGQSAMLLTVFLCYIIILKKKKNKKKENLKKPNKYNNKTYNIKIICIVFCFCLFFNIDY